MRETNIKALAKKVDDLIYEHCLKSCNLCWFRETCPVAFGKKRTKILTQIYDSIYLELSEKKPMHTHKCGVLCHKCEVLCMDGCDFEYKEGFNACLKQITPDIIRIKGEG